MNGESMHLSRRSAERIENLADQIRDGKMVKVKALEAGKVGCLRLSMKQAGKNQ